MNNTSKQQKNQQQTQQRTIPLLLNPHTTTPTPKSLPPVNNQPHHHPYHLNSLSTNPHKNPPPVNHHPPPSKSDLNSFLTTDQITGIGNNSNNNANNNEILSPPLRTGLNESAPSKTTSLGAAQTEVRNRTAGWFPLKKNNPKISVNVARRKSSTAEIPPTNPTTMISLMMTNNTTSNVTSTNVTTSNNIMSTMTNHKQIVKKKRINGIVSMNNSTVENEDSVVLLEVGSRSPSLSPSISPRSPLKRSLSAFSGHLLNPSIPEEPLATDGSKNGIRLLSTSPSPTRIQSPRKMAKSPRPIQKLTQTEINNSFNLKKKKIPALKRRPRTEIRPHRPDQETRPPRPNSKEALPKPSPPSSKKTSKTILPSHRSKSLPIIPLLPLDNEPLLPLRLTNNPEQTLEQQIIQLQLQKKQPQRARLKTDRKARKIRNLNNDNSNVPALQPIRRATSLPQINTIKLHNINTNYYKLSSRNIYPLSPPPQPSPLGLRGLKLSARSCNPKYMISDIKRNEKKEKRKTITGGMELYKLQMEPVRRALSVPIIPTLTDNIPSPEKPIVVKYTKSGYPFILHKTGSLGSDEERLMRRIKNLSLNLELLSKRKSLKRGKAHQRIKSLDSIEPETKRLSRSRSMETGTITIRSTRRSAKSSSPSRSDDNLPVDHLKWKKSTRAAEPDTAYQQKRLVLDIRIIKARIVHPTLLNPYCLIKIGDTTYRTERRVKTLEPVWDADCSFVHFPRDGVIRFLIYHKLKVWHHCLGEVSIKIGDVYTMARDREYGFPIKCRGDMVGKLYVQLQINDSTTGMLSHFGIPLSQEYPVRVKPGDIALFSHNRVAGVLIKVATSSQWNHVGIIMPGFINSNNLRVLHATTAGVIINSLSSTFNTWTSGNRKVKLGIRRILDISPEKLKQIPAILTNFYINIEGRPYGNLSVMMKALLHTNQDTDLSKLFCSELVAASLKEMGFLPKDTISSNFVPGDFARSNFKLVNASLSDVIKIHRTSDRTVRNKLG